RSALAVALLFCSSLAIHTPAAGQDDPAASQQAAFQDWLAQLRQDARERGISERTLDEILPTIEPQRQVIQADRNQAEFVDTYARYLERVSPWRIEKGQELLREQG